MRFNRLYSKPTPPPAIKDPGLSKLEKPMRFLEGASNPGGPTN